MHCPFCRHGDSRVIDSRIAEDGTAIRRRRQCPECGRRFTTNESASLTVLKRSGASEPFSRDKVLVGVRKACQGRPVSEDDLARLAAGAMAPKPAPLVELTHLHTNTVSLTEQVGLVADRLRREGALTFRALIAGCDRLTTVVRFLALLELFRVSQVALEQLSPLGELTVRWTAGDDRTELLRDCYRNSLRVADEIEARWDLPARKWLKVFKPVEK